MRCVAATTLQEEHVKFPNHVRVPLRIQQDHDLAARGRGKYEEAQDNEFMVNGPNRTSHHFIRENQYPECIKWYIQIRV